MAEKNMAVIRVADGYIENIIVVDGVFDPGPGKTLMDATDARIGGTWDGTQYIPPLPPTIPPPTEIEILHGALIAKGVIVEADLDAAKTSLMV